MVQKLIEANAEGVIQEAIHSELFASHLYKHVANQLQRIGYFGAAKYFRSEAGDELEHYQRHVDFLNDLGSVAEVPALPACTEAVASLGDALTLAFETERDLMNAYAEWIGQVDAVTAQHLLQFIEIQRKSVGEYGDLLARLDRVADDSCGIMLLDQEMGRE